MEGIHWENCGLCMTTSKQHIEWIVLHYCISVFLNLYFKASCSLGSRRKTIRRWSRAVDESCSFGQDVALLTYKQIRLITVTEIYTIKSPIVFNVQKNSLKISKFRNSTTSNYLLTYCELACTLKCDFWIWCGYVCGLWKTKRVLGKKRDKSMTGIFLF